MAERVSTLEIRKRLGDILNRVALRHDEFIIERKGEALAAMISVEKLQQLEALAGSRLLAFLQRKVTDLSPARADALADEA